MLPSTNNARPPAVGARGVLDTFSAGYALVNRHPWLILVPVLLDLILWTGPRLSIAPLIADFLRATTVPAELGPEYADTIAAARDSLTAMAQDFNLMGLLAGSFVGLPTLIGASALGFDLLPAAPLTIPLDNWLALAAAVPLLLLASVWIAALYLAPLAVIVRGGAAGRGAVARHVLITGLRLSVWLGLLVAVAVLAGAPLVLVAGVLMVINANLASFFSGLLWISLMWLALYLFFVVPSLTVGQAGVFRSVWNSLNVVRWNLSPALAVVVLVNIIQRGLPFVWESLAGDAWGLPLSIVVNAYIGTGLMAGCMLFFRERYAIWQMWLQAAEARKAAPAAAGQGIRENGQR